jgi:hypothetical protein
MDRAEIAACRSNGEDIFSGLSSNSQLEKKCLAFRGSLHFIELTDSSPRSTAIVGFAYIDSLLEALLKSRLISDRDLGASPENWSS